MTRAETFEASDNATPNVPFDQRATCEGGHLVNEDNRLDAGVSRIHSPKEDVVSRRVIGHGVKSDPAFAAFVRVSTVAGLKKAFPEEFRRFDSVCKRVGRSRGAFSLHPDFRSFAAFLIDLGPIPGPSYSVDRLNPHDTEYRPGGVRWASPKEQAANQRDRVEVRGRGDEVWTTSELSRLQGISAATIRKRRERGWSDTEITAGRRLSGQASHDAPSRAEATPAGDHWPEGTPTSAQARWAEPLRRFRELVPNAPRRMFAAFVLQHRIKEQDRRVQAVFPDWGPGHDPSADPPPGYLSHPEVMRLHSMKDVYDRAYWSLNETQQADLRNYRLSPCFDPIRHRLGMPLVAT